MMTELHLTDEDLERFREKVKVQPSGCHEWQGAIGDSGYGQFFYSSGTYKGTRNIRAHRVAYIIATGETLTSKDYICHTCDNRRCVNPEHLFKGDARINAHDAIEKGRHPSAKLGKKDVERMYQEYDKGATVKELSKRFGVHDRTVRNIVAGRSYKNLHKKWVKKGGGRRVKETTETKKQLLIMIPEDHLWELKQYAAKNRTTQTSLVLNALRECYDIGKEKKHDSNVK